MATSVNNRICKGGQVRQSFINGQMCGGNVQCQLPGCLVLDMYHVKVSSCSEHFSASNGGAIEIVETRP